MSEQEKSVAHDRLLKMILTLLGVVGAICVGFYQYGTKLSAWPSWYLIIAGVIGIWSIFDIVGFFSAQKKR